MSELRLDLGADLQLPAEVAGGQTGDVLAVWRGMAVQDHGQIDERIAGLRRRTN